MVFGDARISYAEARRFVHAIATGMKQEDALSEQARIAVYSPNDWRVPLLQFGANRADFAWIGVHDRNSVETNVQVLGFAECEALFFNSCYEQSVALLKDSLPGIKLWVCIDKESTHGPSLQNWLSGHWDEFPYRHADPHRPALIAPTGGTTGPSKAAVHSHYSLEMMLMLLASELMPAGTRMLSVAPLSHAAGTFAFGLLPLGGTNVILGKFDPAQVLSTIAAERITHVFLPPTMVYALLVHPLIEQTDLSSLTHLIVGAAPVAPEKFKEAVRVFGPILYEAYAQSESGLLILLKRPRDYLREDGTFDEDAVRSAGRAATFSRVEIMNDEGVILPPGQAGEIVVRSALGMTGYDKNVQATVETSLFGFHHTGDVGVMDARGLITIVDRKKDMIVSGGFNVFPNEIELVVNEHPAVLDCIVVGVPDEKWGEAVKAVVQLKPGCQSSADEIIALCRARLGGLKTPKTVEIWADLPRSAVGKLLRREVRAKFWEGQWRSV